MTWLLNWCTLIYDVSFVVLTLILLIYTIKTYYNQKKQPYRLVARVNYCFMDKQDDAVPVVIDIINAGDYVAESVKIRLVENHKLLRDLDCINFIAPRETFNFYLGMLDGKKLILYNDVVLEFKNPMDYDYFELTTNKNVITLTVRVLQAN
ncbi:MAG: hypothetical protein NC416_13380 [Eubacterium sp.]|nr:hypothetical protein [Eubacterium sp.]